MSGRWSTQRGDDWSYADGDVVAEGSWAAGAFEITAIKGFTVRPTTLHGLLWDTSRQFGDAQIRVVLDRVTQAAMATLAASSLVEWNEFRQPYSLWANVARVAPPESR